MSTVIAVIVALISMGVRFVLRKFYKEDNKKYVITAVAVMALSVLSVIYTLLGWHYNARTYWDGWSGIFALILMFVLAMFLVVSLVYLIVAKFSAWTKPHKSWVLPMAITPQVLLAVMFFATTSPVGWIVPTYIQDTPRLTANGTFEYFLEIRNRHGRGEHLRLVIKDTDFMQTRTIRIPYDFGMLRAADGEQWGRLTLSSGNVYVLELNWYLIHRTPRGMRLPRFFRIDMGNRSVAILR